MSKLSAINIGSRLIADVRVVFPGGSDDRRTCIQAISARRVSSSFAVDNEHYTAHRGREYRRPSKLAARVTSRLVASDKEIAANVSAVGRE